jgi:UPF0755 protein
MKWIKYASFFFFLTLIILTIQHIYWATVWTYEGERKVVEISEGEPFAKINQKLFLEGLHPDRRLFHYLAKYQGVMTQLKQGHFIIPSGTTMHMLLDILIKPALGSLVTIPEGKNLYEIASILESKKIVKAKEFIKACHDKKWIEYTGYPKSRNVEGFLFPESYSFTEDMEVNAVIKKMIDLFHERMNTLMEQKHSSLSPYQVLTLASIVEKETGARTERPIIASVFLNRLRLNMRLQSDPTTIYGMWKRYDGNIRKKDLLAPSLYNTYVIPGLPPGPICSPGFSAYEAVMRPAVTKFLYFVSRNDGTHLFSENYDDHRRAVDKFQKNATAREGKSWRQLKQ